MKYYNRFKNLILAGLVGFIYYKYIVPSVPILNKLLALAFVCTFVFDILETLDIKKRAKMRARREERQEMERVHSLGKDKCTQKLNTVRLYTNQKGKSNVRKRKAKETSSDYGACTRC